MFRDCKKFYTSNANNYTGWNKLSRSELCNKYLELIDKGDTLTANYCLSGIICKFLNVATHMYYSQEKQIATESDCYNVLIDAITYALENHVWTNPDSSLYKDPNGPEKAINVRFCSLKVNFFVANQRAKRVLNSNSLSLDKISEDASDAYFLRYDAEDYNKYSYIKYLVKSAFNKGYFLKAFLIDSIVTYDFLDHLKEDNGIQYEQFNYRKLRHHLRYLDDNYCKTFAFKYELDYNKVNESVSKVLELSHDKMDRRTKAILRDLSTDITLISNLRGE